MNPLQIVYGVIGLALTLGLAGGIWHCWNVTSEYAEFRARVEKAGKEAEAKRIKKEAADKLAKEKADAESKRLMADNTALARKLRDARASSRFLPTPSALATSPSRACFDRAILERTLQRFDEGVSAVVAEGDAARVSLDAARVWAAGR